MSDDHCDVMCVDQARAMQIREQVADADATDRIAQLAHGLADPARAQIASALLEAGELCVCDIAWIVDRPQNTVSHHLRLMRASGTAVSRRDGKFVLYSLSGAGRALTGSLIEQDAITT